VFVVTSDAGFGGGLFASACWSDFSINLIFSFSHCKNRHEIRHTLARKKMKHTEERLTVKVLGNEKNGIETRIRRTPHSKKPPHHIPTQR